jgi:predicted dienelactone hydrolase
VAVGGEVAGRGLPLVVMSHGSGGSFAQHYDTALALAEAGFVVAAVTHTGDNYRDQSASLATDPRKGAAENRPRHIKALIDYMLASWPQHDRLDPMRIGIFGHSAGGFTALVAIGGVPDLSLGPSYCAAHPDEWGAVGPAKLECQGVFRLCRLPSSMTRASPLQWSRHLVSSGPSRRNDSPASRRRSSCGTAIVTTSCRTSATPNLYEGLPAKPEYHLVSNAGHFAFLARCTPALERIAPEGCRDPAGFDRAAFHREFNPAVVVFFKAKLHL